LEKEPSKRLGFKRGTEEIKEHPFFADMDWNKMYDRKLITPYKPILDSQDDTKHFVPEITDIPIESPTHELSPSGGNTNS
jgi:hypothetical protein